MIYTELTKRAIKLMYKVHENQLDHSGIPYVFHPWHVAENMDDENSTVVALLHDTLEDSKLDIKTLKQYGFTAIQIEALELLTHDLTVPYDEYIKGISKNEIATKVKLKDLEHNMDLERLKKVTPADLERVEKYRKAHDYLSKIQKDRLREPSEKKNIK